MSEYRVPATGRFSVRGMLAIGGRLAEGAVVIEGGRICAIRRGDPAFLPEPVLDAAIVAPGLIDLQVNGGFGKEVGVDADAIAHLARSLPQTGVTTFLPTMVSADAAAYPRLFAAFEQARAWPAARPEGLHLEGPFLAPARRGAHSLGAIEDATDELFEIILANDDLRLVTMAPERDGGYERIRRLAEIGVVVGLGHTDGSYEAVVAGADAGATMVTHIYNAMSPFQHRAPGATGAALVDDRLTVGMIADGVHAHPAALDLVIRAKGPHLVALVTDMMAAAGMPPGRYALGGNEVTMSDGAARLQDGTLAGSVLTLDQAVRNVVHWGLATPAEAIMMATEVPAKLLGLGGPGKLALERNADLTLFDAQLTVTHTIVGGAVVYTR